MACSHRLRGATCSKEAHGELRPERFVQRVQLDCALELGDQLRMLSATQLNVEVELEQLESQLFMPAFLDLRAG